MLCSFRTTCSIWSNLSSTSCLRSPGLHVECNGSHIYVLDNGGVMATFHTRLAISLTSPVIILPINYSILLQHPSMKPYLPLYSHTWLYADIHLYTIIAIHYFDTFHTRHLATYHFQCVATNNCVLSQNLPWIKSTRTQLCITDINKNDGNLQTA